jgi:ribose transport system permease protein
MLPVSFVVVFAFFASVRPTVFLTWLNFRSMLDQSVVLAILGVGLTIVLTGGDFDLSLPGTIQICGSAAVYSMAFHGQGWVGAIVVAVGLGAIIGAVNGYVVAYLGAEAFIVTLAMGFVLEGLDLSFTHGQVVYNGLSGRYVRLATDTVGGGLRLFVLVSLVVVLLAWVLTEYTAFGRGIHAIGGNRTAAVNAGIPVKRYRAATFMCMGALAGLTAVVITSRAGSAFEGAGDGLLVQPYAAAFLGASVTHRRFHPGATFLGVVFMGTLSTGLILTGQADWVTNVITGLVLMVAVVVAAHRSRPRWLDRISRGIRARS